MFQDDRSQQCRRTRARLASSAGTAPGEIDQYVKTTRYQKQANLRSTRAGIGINKTKFQTSQIKQQAKHQQKDDDCIHGCSLGVSVRDS